MNSSSPIEEAVEAAAAYIEFQRCADGLWRDFHTLAGSSSDWVTGFVSYAITSSDLLKESILDALKTLLYRQRSNGGWSYNETVPTDCDSTAWVLLSLSTAPTWKPSAIRRAIQYVKSHCDASLGGFSTYAVSDRIDRFIGASDQSLTHGWLGVHTCVTGVAIQSLLVHGEPLRSEIVHNATSYLLQKREVSGVWRSYWWKGYGYSTYHALRALSMVRALNIQEARRASRFLLSRQQEDGSWSDGPGEESGVFSTAFILLSLLLFPDEEILKAAERGISWLLQCQNSDGSWPTVPILRIPPPMIKEPESVEEWRLNREGTGVIIEDSARLFTSAAALWALSVFKSLTA